MVPEDSRDSAVPTPIDGQLGLPVVARRAKRIVAFGGGKGGVGKSLISANVAIFLAQIGKRVVLLDGDLGGANAHSFVGVERPTITLSAFFEKRVARIEEVVIPTQIANLGLVSGEGDPLGAANSRPGQRERLISNARDLDVDFLILDLPPGSGFTALDLFLMGDVGVLVVVPEPTSVENTFRFIKSAFLRRLRAIPGIDGLLSRDFGAEGGIPAPLDLLEAARQQEAGSLADALAQEMRLFRPRLIMNQTRTRADLELGQALRSSGRRRLGLAVDFMGHIETDDAVRLAVRKRRPLVVENPESKGAKNIERIARRILATESERPIDRDWPRAPGEPNHYETLEAEPTASEEELRRAFRRVRELYAPDSLAVCGLYSPERLAALSERIQEAYDTLLDPERRRRHDQTLWPDGQPKRRGLTPVLGVPHASVNGAMASAPRLDESASMLLEPEPDISPQTEFTGEFLRKVREARGVGLEDISSRTKIGIGHLRSIEGERFDVLPAKVYVRGFLVSYAKALRLDPAQVVKSYLERYQAAMKPE